MMADDDACMHRDLYNRIYRRNKTNDQGGIGLSEQGHSDGRWTTHDEGRKEDGMDNEWT
jgi:hypothetical protein